MTSYYQRAATGDPGDDGRGRGRPEVDLRSGRPRWQGAATGGPAPKGGTAGSASAKVPSAAWPRDASERQQEEASNAARLAGIVEDEGLRSSSDAAPSGLRFPGRPEGDPRSAVARRAAGAC